MLTQNFEQSRILRNFLMLFFLIFLPLIMAVGWSLQYLHIPMHDFIFILASGETPDSFFTNLFFLE